MTKTEICEEFCKIIGKEQVLLDEPMRNHTTFRIGGPADYYLVPQSVEQVEQVLIKCKELGLPFFILGNGSNLLVSDLGYRGVVIQIYKNLSGVVREGDKLRVAAGTLLSQVARSAMEAELGGFAFAAGIPGTIGGAVVMNAGAYGGEMKDVLTEALVLTKEGKKEVLTVDELELGYRTSRIKKQEEIVLEAVIKLSEESKESILAEMNRLKEMRVSKQPLEYPSAGSTFKRPEGYFAGKLIMDAGLRGFRVGGAQVSEKHCGFVINVGNATAKDVVDLMEAVKNTVYEKYQVQLEPEVKFLGDFT
ncbi:MAG: UDP-N-acetylmuramate dehydrogenase [Lachnospiraceae bacterium]|jgi:UDP-N-acetylmuramate dehydrogenase|nr:UDP-N-acetylmuramate dehydrogenase [Lachnospiraceae bacterium]MDD3616891.1 UDP-N-acetylmuramate dehydrogenase [Lachnospiraceae bacterium]